MDDQPQQSPYAVSQKDGSLLHWDGNAWGRMQTPGDGEAFAISQKTGLPLHYTGGAWGQYQGPNAPGDSTTPASGGAPQDPSWLDKTLDRYQDAYAKGGRWGLATQPAKDVAEGSVDAAKQIGLTLPRVGASLIKGGAGLEQMASEQIQQHPIVGRALSLLPGSPAYGLGLLPKHQLERVSKAAEDVRQYENKIDTEPDFQPATPLGHGAKFAGDTAGVMGKAVLLGPAAIPEFGAEAMGNRYAQARSEGATVNQATGEGVISGGINAGLAALPAGAPTSMKQAVAQRLARAIVFGGGSTVAENMATRIHNPNQSATEGIIGGIAGFAGMEGAGLLHDVHPIAARRAVMAHPGGSEGYIADQLLAAHQATEGATLDAQGNVDVKSLPPEQQARVQKALGNIAVAKEFAQKSPALAKVVQPQPVAEPVATPAVAPEAPAEDPMASQKAALADQIRQDPDAYKQILSTAGDPDKAQAAIEQLAAYQNGEKGLFRDSRGRPRPALLDEARATANTVQKAMDAEVAKRMAAAPVAAPEASAQPAEAPQAPGPDLQGPVKVSVDGADYFKNQDGQIMRQEGDKVEPYDADQHGMIPQMELGEAEMARAKAAMNPYDGAVVNAAKAAESPAPAQPEAMAPASAVPGLLKLNPVQQAGMQRDLAIQGEKIQAARDHIEAVHAAYDGPIQAMEEAAKRKAFSMGERKNPEKAAQKALKGNPDYLMMTKAIADAEQAHADAHMQAEGSRALIAHRYGVEAAPPIPFTQTEGAGATPAQGSGEVTAQPEETLAQKNARLAADPKLFHIDQREGESNADWVKRQSKELLQPGNWRTMLEKAAQDPTTLGGKIIRADDFQKQLSSVHEHPVDGYQNVEYGGDLATEAYKARLTDPSLSGDEAHIMMGAPGSGKTTQSEVVGADPNARVVFDGPMTSFKSQEWAIDEALKHGLRPVVDFVMQPDFSQLGRDMVDRADTEKRSVPVGVQARTYVDQFDTLGKITQKYGDKVRLRVFDRGDNQWHEGEDAYQRVTKNDPMRPGETTDQATRRMYEVGAKAVEDHLVGRVKTGRPVSEEIEHEIRNQSGLTPADEAYPNGRVSELVHEPSSAAPAESRGEPIAKSDGKPAAGGARNAEEASGTGQDEGRLRGRREEAPAGDRGAVRADAEAGPRSRKLRGGRKTEPAPAQAPAAEEEVARGFEKYPDAGGLKVVPTADLSVHPEMQYKPTDERTGLRSKSESGETGSIKDAKVWNNHLAGITSAWRDPETGKLLIVNGHNRLAKARELGVPSLRVAPIEAENFQQAKVIGALQNIGEGRGTVLDAAEILRKSKLTPADLEAAGVALKSRVAKGGIALSNLSENSYRLLTSEPRLVPLGEEIGGSGLNHAQQDAVVNLIHKGGDVDVKPTVLHELITEVKNASVDHGTQGGMFDLESVDSNLEQRADLAAAVNRELSKDTRVFGTLGRQANQERIGQVGTVDTAGATEKANQSRTLQSIFQQERGLKGEVNDTLNEYANQLKEAKSAKDADRIRRETVAETKRLLMGKTTGSREQGAGTQGGEGLFGAERGVPGNTPSSEQSSGSASSATEPAHGDAEPLGSGDANGGVTYKAPSEVPEHLVGTLHDPWAAQRGFINTRIWTEPARKIMDKLFGGETTPEELLERVKDYNAGNFQDETIRKMRESGDEGMLMFHSASIAGGGFDKDGKWQAVQSMADPSHVIPTANDLTPGGHTYSEILSPSLVTERGFNPSWNPLKWANEVFEKGHGPSTDKAFRDTQMAANTDNLQRLYSRLLEGKRGNKDAINKETEPIRLEKIRLESNAQKLSDKLDGLERHYALQDRSDAAAEALRLHHLEVAGRGTPLGLDEADTKADELRLALRKAKRREADSAKDEAVKGYLADPDRAEADMRQRDAYRDQRKDLAARREALGRELAAKYWDARVFKAADIGPDKLPPWLDKLMQPGERELAQTLSDIMKTQKAELDKRGIGTIEEAYMHRPFSAGLDDSAMRMMGEARLFGGEDPKGAVDPDAIQFHEREQGSQDWNPNLFESLERNAPQFSRKIADKDYVAKWSKFVQENEESRPELCKTINDMMRSMVTPNASDTLSRLMQRSTALLYVKHLWFNLHTMVLHGSKLALLPARVGMANAAKGVSEATGAFLLPAFDRLQKMGLASPDFVDRVASKKLAMESVIKGSQHLAQDIEFGTGMRSAELRKSILGTLASVGRWPVNAIERFNRGATFFGSMAEAQGKGMDYQQTMEHVMQNMIAIDFMPSDKGTLLSRGGIGGQALRSATAFAQTPAHLTEYALEQLGTLSKNAASIKDAATSAKSVQQFIDNFKADPGQRNWREPIMYMAAVGGLGMALDKFLNADIFDHLYSVPGPLKWAASLGHAIVTGGKMQNQNATNGLFPFADEFAKNVSTLADGSFKGAALATAKTVVPDQAWRAIESPDRKLHGAGLEGSLRHQLNIPKADVKEQLDQQSDVRHLRRVRSNQRRVLNRIGMTP